MTALKERLYSLKGAIFLLCLYGFAHSVLRLSASHNLGENDPVSALKTQSFQAFWESGAAPFDFLVLLLSEVFGPSVFIFQILRYGLLGLSLLFVFLSARHITGSSFWALLSVEAYALIYQISWRFHEGFTYPLIAMLSVSAVFWLFLKIEQEKKNSDILLALFFVGVGALTGIWFLAFLLSFAIGLTFVSLTQKNILFIIMIFGIALGFGYLYQTGFFEGDIVAKTALEGGGKAALKVIAYLSPLLPILLLIFGWSYKNGLKRQDNSFYSWLLYATLSAILGVVVVSTYLQDAPFSEHALMPLFFLTPLLMMDFVRRLEPKAWQIKSFVGLCLLLMCIAFVGRAANLYILDPVCKRCYFGIPYQGLAENLKSDEDFKDVKKVISPSTRLSGNLYSFWSDITYLFPDAALEEGMLIIWPSTMADKDLVSWLSQKGIADQTARELVSNQKSLSIGWPHFWREFGYRTTVWKVLVFKNDL